MSVTNGLTGALIAHRQPARATLAGPDLHLPEAAAAAGQAVAQCMALPFDATRMQYAHAVQLGLVERSMLGSHHFEALLQSLERLMLGPWARRV